MILLRQEREDTMWSWRHVNMADYAIWPKVLHQGIAYSTTK